MSLILGHCLNSEEKVIEALKGYPRYRNLLPPDWKSVPDEDPLWWKNMCSDYPSEEIFRQRFAIASIY